MTREILSGSPSTGTSSRCSGGQLRHQKARPGGVAPHPPGGGGRGAGGDHGRDSRNDVLAGKAAGTVTCGVTYGLAAAGFAEHPPTSPSTASRPVLPDPPGGMKGGPWTTVNPFPVKPLLVFVAVVARSGCPSPSRRRPFSPRRCSPPPSFFMPPPPVLAPRFPGVGARDRSGRSVAFFALLLAGRGRSPSSSSCGFPCPRRSPRYHGTFPLTAAMAAHHLLLVALPEEVFFRGYLYDASRRRGGTGGARSPMLFAIGHFAIATRRRSAC